MGQRAAQVEDAMAGPAPPCCRTVTVRCYSGRKRRPASRSVRYHGRTRVYGQSFTLSRQFRMAAAKQAKKRRFIEGEEARRNSERGKMKAAEETAGRKKWNPARPCPADFRPSTFCLPHFYRFPAGCRIEIVSILICVAGSGAARW